jgi:hypothetical protein
MGQPTPDELHRESINRAARARIDQIKKQLFHWMVKTSALPMQCP